jgi:hypothetical protein
MAYVTVDSDLFNVAGDAVISTGGNWVHVRDTVYPGTIRYSVTVANRAVGRYSSGGANASEILHHAVYVRAAGTYDRDQYVKMTIGGIGDNWGITYKIGAALRCTTDTNNDSVGYYCYVVGDASSDTNSIRFVKTNGTLNGQTVGSVTNPSIDWQNDDVILFEAVGDNPTVLTLYRAPASTPTVFTQIATASDSTSPLTTANRPGIFIGGDDSVSAAEVIWANDWEGGNVTSSGTAVPVFMSNLRTQGIV